jgi:hypothetical protein
MHQHKDHCEELLEKLVNRVGESLREIFYVFSKRAFSTKVIQSNAYRHPGRQLDHKGSSIPLLVVFGASQASNSLSRTLLFRD